MKRIFMQKFDNKLKIMSDDIINKMSVFGMLQYSIEKICLILSKDIEPELLKCEFENLQSKCRISYERGKASAVFSVDKSLFDLANKGDIDAIEMISELKSAEEYEIKRKELFG